ncbi:MULTISPECIES: CpaF family protein [Clostridium]|uniref:CpaF family protein n=1 Tax=Clostridium cibarium TaxID=2762247 RepID=A0ABR8PPN8_9CLOT|nr:MULTISPECIES: CpaF family protein [Clostridium]MBD7910137.1 CpaF family protein [Clostridium cibarium]
MKEELKQQIIDEVNSMIRDDRFIQQDLSDEDARDVISKEVFQKTKSYAVSVSEKIELVNTVYNSIRKLDVLQPLVDDKDITEIMINGHKNIFVEKDGEVIQVKTVFEDQKKLENLIQKIVSDVNRVVNESSPIVDARLKDGSRVNVVLPPISLCGPIVTIRKFPEDPMTVEKLIRYGSITPDVAKLLQNFVLAKYNVFISGGTGSGKTTFLNALSNFIPRDERVITIEDSAELQIENVDNIVRLETRNANTEGKGEISIRDLIKSSLRMRPDRIVVGEVRGAEALDMLQAMNTGHDGSLSTGHANSTKDMLSRLETMVLTGVNFPIQAIRQQISSALDIIVHLGRLRDRSRKVLEIAEVLGIDDDGNIKLNPLYVFKEEGETESGKIIGSLVRTENELVNKEKLSMAGIHINV